MATLEINDAAPDFNLSDSDGRHWSLADFRGSKAIIYFYPAALTPGCTIQAVDFSSRLEDFAAAGYQIVGISPDTPAKLARFITAHSLSVTLLSDPDKTTLLAYGAWGTKILYGKEMEGVIRSTFIVDVPAEGPATILDARYGVKATGHVERLARDLDF